MPKRNKQSFLHGALILSFAAILTKIIGALLFKIPLQNINMTAYGYFTLAFNIYVPIYTVSTAGFPIAVSRMVSHSLTLGRYRDIKIIHKVANKVFLITGSVGTLLMILSAFIYPSFVKMENARLAMLVMAPSVLFCCLLTSYRGVYGGSRNMIPTAISQIVEAVGKLIFGISLAAGALYLGQWQFSHGQVVYGIVAESSEQALEYSLPYIAAGGMFGVTAGSFFSFAYLVLFYRRNGSGITRQELENAPKPKRPNVIFRSLLRFAIPVALGTLATQLTTLIDAISFQKCLAIVIEKNGNILREIYSQVISAGKVNDLNGFLTGTRDAALTYVNLVPNITLSLGISALPVITSAWALNDRVQLRRMVSNVLRITLLISLPSGIGLSVLAKPILKMFYDPFVVQVAGPQLEVLGISVVFICLVAPINAMLQAMGRADVPAKIVLVGGAVKLFLNIVLVLNPRINVIGSAYSTVACYTIMVILSFVFLKRIMGMKLRWRSIFLKPLFATVCCSTAAWAVNGILSRFVSNSISVLSAISVAVFVYIWALLSIRAVKREDVLMLPKGQKIAQILEKYDWIG
ncbi:MAG TPA: polysaccharide biosynthesis protein [Ruminococcaceae bacterium]|nr:polysaccharide biosynthesis protein [Oscillospiraceae bacterium]